MPTVADLLRDRTSTGISIEVLPPIKGKGLVKLNSDLDKLMAFKPLFVNITTHHSEPVYQTLDGGNLRKRFVRKRPGTVAVAAAIKHKYGVPTVPHIICTGFSPEETEYVLIDLNFLGISDLFVLRGDIDKEVLVPKEQSHQHATDLIGQIRNFNEGISIDGEHGDKPETPFSFGVAGYPEKHFEAPNTEEDIKWLKKKVELGAEYVVTQLFYDNDRFYDFVSRARTAGIDVPIIPGLKPISRKAQLNVLPRVFATQLPAELVAAVNECPDDAAVKRVGQQWLLRQCQDLKEHGVPCIHFYTLGAVDTVCEVLRQL